MSKLRLYFEQAGFQGEALEKVLEGFTLKPFAKGDFFIEEGKVCRHLAFVESGLFQYYTLANGDEITTYVVGEGGFLTSLVSFLGQTPTRENLRCMADGALWMIHHDAMRRQLETVPGFKDFYIGLLEWQIGCIDNSRFDFILLSAEERYEKMMREEPHMLQQIPLQLLASILGITPRHLSRIRKNIV